MVFSVFLNKKPYLAFSLLVLFFISCEKLSKDRGVIIADYDINHCYQVSIQHEGGFAIKSQTELDSLSLLYSCTLPSIDFSEKIILVYVDNLPGCDFDVQSTVTESKEESQYEFILWVKGGTCPLNYSQVGFFAVIVPRPPDYYNFRFKTEILN